MPLLFSILEHYNLLSKQPNYTCGLVFFDLMLMVVSWARAIMSISKKAWTFPGRPYYYILHFQKLIESPTTEGTEGHTGPPGQPRGEEVVLQVPFSSRDVTAWARPGGSRQDIPFAKFLSPFGGLSFHFSDGVFRNIKDFTFLSWDMSFSHVWLFATPWTAACQASLSITNSWSGTII